jgi:putative tryptophan/tyrosine transport system substrate-binding protein
VRRREFIALVAGVAPWPLPARAQQSTMPVIGFLDFRSPESIEDRLREFRRGLKQTGYIEGDNVIIVYRGPDNDYARLSALANELVQRPVAVIVASGGLPVALAAKAATPTIPIVFLVAEDPVKLGLVVSLAQPAGNMTGINFLNTEVTEKRLELLRELLPGAARVAVLVNPANAANSDMTWQSVEAAARLMKLKVQVFKATSSREIDAVFASFERERPDVLFVGQDALFTSRRLQLANLSARHAIPLTAGSRDIAEVGGLMSYGSNILDAYRHMGVYAGRILRGAKPAEMPVEQATKLELVINLQTARMLGIDVPAKLLAIADEVIE